MNKINRMVVKNIVNRQIRNLIILNTNKTAYQNMVICTLFLIILFVSCKRVERNSNGGFYSYENHVENFETNMLKNLNTIHNPTIISDEFFYELRFPFRNFQNPVRVRLTGFVKKNENIKDVSFVCTLDDRGETVYWEAKQLVNSLSDSAWQKIDIELRIPASEINNKTLVVYIWNPKKLANKYEQLEITVEEIKLPSFMVDLNVTIPKELPEVIFSNKYYQILYYQKSKSVLLADINGTPITCPMVCVLDYMQHNRREQEINQKWNLLNTNKSNRKNIFQFQNNIKNGDNIFIKMIGYIDSPEFSIDVSYNPISPITIHRFAFQFDIIDDFSRIMRKNSIEDIANFQYEYHLGNGGIVAGKGYRSLAFNHLTSLSSVQVNTKNKSICFNFDYEFDHPFIHSPLLSDSTDYFTDLSAYKMNPDDSFSSSFNMYIGANTTSLPRFMPVPFGYDAGIIFTEHADWTNIKTNRGVYFGHESIICPNKATGGFVKYNIPVTKSVFYNNPDSVTNTIASKGVFNELHSTIKSDADFLYFLEQLENIGYDICLHTPEQYTSSHGKMTKALDFMQKHFKSSTWIDHGYNNSAINNREDLMCDGWIKQSPLYGIPLWKKYNIKYFWHPYFEDKPVYSKWGFDNNFLQPYPGFGDAFPFHHFATHPMLKDLVLWYTTSVFSVKEPGSWSYLFSDKRLQNLVENRGIYINHVYPAWTNTDRGFWNFDKDSMVIAQPEFNKALSRILEFKNEHKIFPTTITQILDYLSAVKNIKYTINSDGSINLKNNSNVSISGLSMIVSAKKVLVNGKQPSYKSKNGEIIFWFDLKVNDDVRIVTY